MTQEQEGAQSAAAAAGSSIATNAEAMPPNQHLAALIVSTAAARA
ncbi:hypothetical protein [Vulgatibacter sp.]